MGSKNQTATSTTAPNPQAAQAYMGLLNRVNSVAATPYTPYTGELVPGVNSQQLAGIANINQNANFADPYIQQATALATQASQPLTPFQIQQYQSPYTQSVVNATQAQFNNQNTQQLQNVKGNAIAQGALGGNREAVAEAETTNQQNLAQAPVIAGLENQGYQTALQTAEQQQQNQQQGAYSLGNLGVSGQNAALTGANAQVGAGNLQYGVSSAQDQAAYQQFVNQQAFPYQQLQWAAGLDTGLGSNLGGTNTTTSPGPSVLGQVAGLGSTIAGGLGATGAFGSTGWLAPLLMANRGGRIGVAHYDSGGGVSVPQFGGGYGQSQTPYGGAKGWIPSVGITHGRLPDAPRMPQDNSQQQMQQIGSLAKALGSMRDPNGISTSGAGAGAPRVGSPDASQFNDYGYAPVDFSDPGIGFASGPHAMGGRIGLADGGVPDQDASDIVLNGGSGGLGLDAPWQPDNPALHNDARYTPDGTVLPPGQTTLPPEITRGTSRPNYVPPGALSYTDDGRSRSSDTGDYSDTPPHGIAYEHPTTSPWGALMAAGLGMMASRSPFPGVAIGEGGLTGLREYAAENAQNISEAEKKANIEAASRRLENEWSQQQFEKDKFYGTTQQIDTDPETWKPLHGVPDPQHPGQYLDPRTNLPFAPRATPGQDATPTNAEPAAPLAATSVAPLGGRIMNDDPDKMIVNGPPTAQVNPGVAVAYQNPTLRAREMTAQKQEGVELQKKVAGTDSLQYRAVEMGHALDTIQDFINDHPKDKILTALVNPGVTGEERQKMLNTWASVPGNKAPQGVISAINQLGKDSILGGFANIQQSGLSSREALPVIQAARSAMPSFNLPIESSRALLASMRQAAEMVRDEKAFYDAYKLKNGGITDGWWEAFSAQNPPQKYVAKAIYSQLNPQQRQDIGSHVTELRQARDDFMKAEQAKDTAAMTAAKTKYDQGLRIFNSHYNGLGNYFLYGTM